MENKFLEYRDNPTELIGKLVLISSKRSLLIRKIVSLTKTSFKVEGDEKSLYRLKDGDLRGEDAWSRTYAQLITEEEANQLKKEWTEKRLIKEIRERILINFPTDLSLEKLQQIEEILK